MFNNDRCRGFIGGWDGGSPGAQRDASSFRPGHMSVLIDFFADAAKAEIRDAFVVIGTRTAQRNLVFP